MADESEAMAMMVEPFDYAMAATYNGASAADGDIVTEREAPPMQLEPEDEDHVAPREPPTEVAPPTAATASAPTATGGVTTAALFNHELDGELALPDKKTGRPSHPAWEHFVRGSKRNRFHHHAFCKYCTAHGADTVPVRGVSGNMIRHLQKCVYCPEDIVMQLRVLCAQKDAVNYNKRHHHQSQPPLAVDVVGGGVIQATAAAAAAAVGTSDSGPASKKPKRTLDADAFGVTPPTQPAVVSTGGAFAPLQLPTGIPVIAPRASGQTKATSASTKSKSRNGTSSRSSPSVTTQPQPSTVNQAALNRLVLRATLSGGLPLDWMSMEEASRLSTSQQSKGIALPLRVAVYNKDLVSSMSVETQETLIQRLKEDNGNGCTLTINYWFNKAERTNLMLFSLVNALGEATAWKLVDVGSEDAALEELSTQIKDAVAALVEEGVHLIAIVSDNLLAYAAAKAAITGGDDPHPPIAVLPSFEAFLVNAMGVILTISESHVDTMGQVIELVAAFSNARLRETLRRECGDSEAALVLPSRDKWFSFIDCIDSLRQFEDMIKIIGLRVVIHQSEAAAAQRGEEPELTPNSKGTGLSGSVPDIPGPILETIQNPQFWETVVSLSELMSPIKETYKVMVSHSSNHIHNGVPMNTAFSNRNSNSAIMTFSLSDVFYQLGRMYQQYTAIVADWEENPSVSRVVTHARYLQEQVNKTWKLYDQPLMFLSYMLNYNMAPPLLAQNLPTLKWLSIGKFAKEYFRRWFCASPVPSGHRPGTRGTALSEEASTQFLEDVLAFKERKYPFDAESVCDFDNPRAFYQLISDSNPLMHLFGTRLFSFATSVPQLSRVVPGKSSITRVSTSACSQELLFPLIQANLRSKTCWRHSASKDLLSLLQQPSRNARKHSTSETAQSEGSKEALSNGHGPLGSPQLSNGHGPFGSPQLFRSRLSPHSGIWNEREWRLVGKQWKLEWEHEGNVGNVLDTVAGLNSTSGVSSRLVVELLSLDQIFKDKLPSRLQQSREEEAVVDV